MLDNQVPTEDNSANAQVVAPRLARTVLPYSMLTDGNSQCAKLGFQRCCWICLAVVGLLLHSAMGDSSDGHRH